MKKKKTLTRDGREFGVYSKRSKNPVEKVAAHFGSPVELLQALGGMATQNFYQWKRRERFSAHVAIKIERLTEGKFKAVDIAE